MKRIHRNHTPAEVEQKVIHLNEMKLKDRRIALIVGIEYRTVGRILDRSDRSSILTPQAVKRRQNAAMLRSGPDTIRPHNLVR